MKNESCTACTAPCAAHFINLRGILSSPVPRIFDEGPHGPMPVENDVQLMGQVSAVDHVQPGQVPMCVSLILDGCLQNSNSK